jgi:hypothetical protein
MITFVIGYDVTNSSYSRSEGFTQNSFFLLLTCPPKVITKTLHPTVPASARWVGALKSPIDVCMSDRKETSSDLSVYREAGFGRCSVKVKFISYSWF